MNILNYLSETHKNGASCPVCGADCRSKALVDLVYTFEPCRCGTPAYDHLYEQLWCRDCFANDKERK